MWLYSERTLELCCSKLLLPQKMSFRSSFVLKLFFCEDTHCIRVQLQSKEHSFAWKKVLVSNPGEIKEMMKSDFSRKYMIYLSDKTLTGRQHMVI